MLLPFHVVHKNNKECFMLKFMYFFFKMRNGFRVLYCTIKYDGDRQTMFPFILSVIFYQVKTDNGPQKVGSIKSNRLI